MGMDDMGTVGRAWWGQPRATRQPARLYRARACQYACSGHTLLSVVIVCSAHTRSLSALKGAMPGNSGQARLTHDMQVQLRLRGGGGADAAGGGRSVVPQSDGEREKGSAPAQAAPRVRFDEANLEANQRDVEVRTWREPL